MVIALQSKLIVHPEKCTGCRICELSCSFFHEKVFNPKKARLRIVRLEPAIDMPITCQQCKKAPCKEICPVEAISLNDDGTVLIDNEKCIACGICVEACPFGAMFVNPENNYPIKCDLCSGNPQCVSHCPTDALNFQVLDATQQNKRKNFAEASTKKFLKKWKIAKKPNKKS